MRISPSDCGSASAPSRKDFICNSCGGSKYSNGARKFLIVLFGGVCAKTAARQKTKPTSPAASGLLGWQSLFLSLLVRIFRYNKLPFVLRFQNHFHNLADRPVAPVRPCYITRGCLGLR